MGRFVFLSVAALMGAVAASGANIVQNPGFETGDFTSWVTDGNFWIVESSDFGISGPNSGTSYADNFCLGSTCTSTPTSFLYQDLATTIGQTYTLTFFYDPGVMNSGPSTTEDLVVQWAGVTVLDLLQTATATTDPGWTQYTVSNLSASSTTTRLQFLGRQDSAELGVDDVNVSAQLDPAPEPATWSLVSGLLLLLFIAAKRPLRS